MQPRTVGEVMTRKIVTVSEQDALENIEEAMLRLRFRHLPVVANGRLVGIVSIGDLVKHRIERIENEAAAMREYIQSA